MTLRPASLEPCFLNEDISLTTQLQLIIDEEGLINCNLCATHTHSHARTQTLTWPVCKRVVFIVHVIVKEIQGERTASESFYGYSKVSNIIQSDV